MDFQLRRLEIRKKRQSAGDPIHVDTDPELGLVRIQAFRELPGWLNSPQPVRVYHSVNGQVYKQACLHLQCAKGSCLKMTESAHSDVWKSDHGASISRDAIRRSDGYDFMITKKPRLETESLPLRG